VRDLAFVAQFAHKSGGAVAETGPSDEITGLVYCTVASLKAVFAEEASTAGLHAVDTVVS